MYIEIALQPQSDSCTLSGALKRSQSAAERSEASDEL